MRAQFGLPSVRNTEEVERRAPISVKFEIPYFTVSGIQVRYLKIVEKSGYQALPWVRYITQHGDDYRFVDYYLCSSKLTTLLSILAFAQLSKKEALLAMYQYDHKNYFVSL